MMLLDDLIRTMPKVDLHVHLEGSVSPDTLRRLAEKQQRLADFNQLSFSNSSFMFSGFNQFRQQFRLITELLKTQDDFALVAYECGKEMFKQNIMYQEMYVSVLLHTYFAHQKIDIHKLLAGLEQGRQQAKEEFGVEIRWIFGIPRRRCFSDDWRYQPAVAETALEYALLGRDFGVVGIGLGGSEVDAPTKPFESIFLEAKDQGLHSIPHAGETAGSENVRDAIIYLKADRIGHGIRAVEDDDVVDLLVDKQIPLDISLSSNVCLNVVLDYESHPVQRLIQAGVAVTLSSDDPTLFGSDLSNEYRLFHDHYCDEISTLIDIAKRSINYCAAGNELKTALHSRFDSWQSSLLFSDVV